MTRVASRRVMQALLALAVAFAGCGGGAGSGDANVAPVSNAGADQLVTAGSLVTLSGSSSLDANGDPVTYQWTLTSRPAGSQAVLAGATSVAPTFTADFAGTYVVSLVVSDGKASSAATTVTVIAALNQTQPGTLVFTGSNGLGSSVFTIRPDGSSQRQLTPFVGDSSPTFSPDASRIVFQRGFPSLFVMNADGSDLQSVFDATFSSSEHVMTPSWTPDDGLIVFAKARPVASSILNLAFDICFFEIDATTPPRCIPANAQEQNFAPNVSPDRRKIAYTCLWTDGLQLNVSQYYVRICVMNLDGSGIVQLTSGDFHILDDAPVWSPDGSKIAFNRQTGIDATGSYEDSAVYVMNSDGSALTRLTPPSLGFCESPAWSPDGRKLAFVPLATPGKISIINTDGSNNADGSNLLTISTGLANVETVSWSRR